MYLQNIVLLMLKKHLVYTLILFLHLEESVSTVSFILFTHSSHSRSHRVSGGGGGGGGSTFFCSSRHCSLPLGLFLSLWREKDKCLQQLPSVCVFAQSDHPTANLARPSCFPLLFLFFPVSLFRHVSQFPIASQLYLQTRLSGFYYHSVRSESVSVVKCMLASQDFTPSLLSVFKTSKPQ